MLDGITTLQGYTDWMRDLFQRMPDGACVIKGSAVDEARGVVLAYGIFSGTVGSEGERRMYSSDYVYAMEFQGAKIGHVTKIWNDTYG